MGRYFSLTRAMPADTCKTKTKRKHKINQTSRSRNGFFLFALIMIFGIMYIVQVNNLSTQGYDIQKLEQRLVDLKEQGKRLELESTALKSMENLGEDIKAMNLVPSKNVKYLRDNEYAYTP